MNLELLYIILHVILIFAGLYLVCIWAFTLGLFNLKESFYQFDNQDVKVSILIAAKNEQDSIKNLLSSMNEQSYPKENFEVIIVNDNSEDHTVSTINEFKDSHPKIKIILLEAESHGKKAAITQALHQAENELVMVTDADCCLPVNWIECFVAHYLKKGSKMILGPVLLSPDNTLFEKLQVLEHLSLIASTAGSASLGIPIMCNGANMAYQREAALSVEKYRHDMNIASGDDMFLMEQFIRHLGKDSVCFLYSKQAVVKTKTMPTLKDFFKQRKRWAAKTKAYTNWKIITTALIVLLFNLSIVFFFAGAFFMPVLWVFFVLFILLKFLIDFPILHHITGFFNQSRLMKWCLPLETIYPFYVVITAVSGLFSNLKSWK